MTSAKTHTERRTPSTGVNVVMTVYRYPGEPDGDTTVVITGTFAVSGQSRDEFVKRLGELIDEYRI